MSNRASDVTKGEFSPTGIETGLRCERKFYIQKFLKLSPKGDGLAAYFGQCIHAGIARFYKDHNAKPNDLLEAFMAEWEKSNPQPDAIRNPGTAATVLRNYHDTYQFYRLREFVNPEEVEVPFEILMPNGTIMIGVMDQILRQDGLIQIVDEKTTTSALTDWYWSRYKNSFQMGAYYHACKEVFGSCDNTTISAIYLRARGQADMFSRRPLMRTELQQEEWMNTYLRFTNYVMSMQARTTPEQLPEVFAQRPTACSDFGGCPFLGACTYGLSHPSVVVDMEIAKGELGE